MSPDCHSVRDHSALDGPGTVLFVDEIHRFNKSQQDVLLPMENGTVANRRDHPNPMLSIR